MGGEGCKALSSHQLFIGGILKRTEIDLGNGRTRIIFGESESGARPNSGITIFEYFASDGSRLEKPMSKAYLNNVRSRTFSDSSTSRTIYPGDYGSGKKVPREK